MEMETELDILFLSAGNMEGNLYGSVIVINGDVESVNEKDRIGSGKRHAKVKLDTSNDNRLAKEMVEAFAFPAKVKCLVKTAVKQGEMVMTITNFKEASSAPAEKSNSSIKVAN